MDANGAHVAPKISSTDLKDILGAIRNGFTAMRSDMENQILDQVKAAKEALELEFATRVAEAVEAELERMTAP